MYVDLELWKYIHDVKLVPRKHYESINILILKNIPPNISSLPSPLKTILTPIAFILRDNKYIGVEARIVVTSYVSK